MRTDVLLDQGHAVLPSPASKSSIRRGGGSQSRGGQHFRDCSGRGNCLNTVARWLEQAADVCGGFNQSRLAGFVVEELQADEIRSFVGGKTRLDAFRALSRSLRTPCERFAPWVAPGPRLGSGWRPTLAGWDWLPTGFRTRFQRSHHGILSPLTGLIPAHALVHRPQGLRVRAG